MNNNAIQTDIMEARNLVTAFEMIEYDNWLVPTMNGELRLEKPPLPTWVAAFIQYIAPHNISLQRAASGLMATMLVFFLYLLSSALTRNRLYGLISALVIATSFNIIIASRVASWDIYCHSFMLGAIYFFYRGVNSLSGFWKYFILSGIFLGLSFLGKGPVAFYALLLPFLITYFTIYRTSIKNKGLPIFVMLLIFMVISFWWPIYIYIFHKDMALYVAAKESSAWIDRNVRPWYYYWLFFAETGIWSLFLLTALCFPWLKKKVEHRKEYIFSVMWTIVMVVLLSCFPEKKTRYILPVLIPAAMMISHYIMYIFYASKNHLMTKTDKVVFRINAYIPALIAFALPVALYILFYRENELSLITFIISSLIFILLGLSLVYGAIRIKIWRVFTSVVLLVVILITFLMTNVVSIFSSDGSETIFVVRENSEINALPFHHPDSEELRIEIIYEAGRRILPININDVELITSKTPFVLVSEKPAEEILSDELKNKLEIKQIGIYDNHPRPKDSKRYSPKFRRHVTLIKDKNKLVLDSEI